MGSPPLVDSSLPPIESHRHDGRRELMMRAVTADGAGVRRDEALAAIVDAIDAASCSHPVRVAIDGPAAAGKTTLADELAVALRHRGRDVIRASIEGFLRPRIERYKRGPESSRGCYEDSFYFERLLLELLRPLGESGDRLYRTRVYDRSVDLLVHSEQAEARADSILLFDGVFLLRRELVDAWDFRVLVTAGSRELIRRARIRDAEVFGSPDAAERRHRARYLPAQQHYFRTVRPSQLADIVLENDDPSHPCVLVRS
jgi:uridine kinase